MSAILITASRRTDVPAFYSEWFMKRVEEGFFINVNPFNFKQRRRISLLPEEVDAILFISKNPGPLLKYLEKLDRMEYRYYFHYTLNDYPALIEPRVPPLRGRLEVFRKLSERAGPGKVIWRYDPIVVSNQTPVEYHLERFAKLAERLNGYTGRVIISLLQMYPKVKERLQILELKQGLKVIEIRDELYREDLQRLAVGLSRIAGENGMEITSCAEVSDLRAYGIAPGSCVDVELINKLFGLKLPAKRDKSQRPNCQCAQAVDMGVYDTCKFNCSYCYANRSENAVLRKIANYDVNGPVLGD